MKTLRSAPIVALLGLALAVALVGSSCSATNPVALQVGDWQLSNTDFQDQLSTFADVYAEATSQQQADQRLRGSTTDAAQWSTSFTSEFLNDQMSLQLAVQAAQERDLEVTQADLDQARAQLEQNYSSQTTGESVFGQLSEGYQETLVEGVAAQNVLGSALLEEGVPDELLRRLFEADAATYAQPLACVSHILIVAGDPNSQEAPTDEQYAEALARVEEIRDGLTPETFAAVAAAESDDPGSAAQGGDLGCAPEGAYVTGFEEAVWSQPVGEIGEPVETTFGYHVVLVRSRGQVTFEDVRDQLAAQIEQNPALLLQAELLRMARTVGVSVDGRYGAFDEATGQITPPDGPLQPSTTLSLDDLSSLLGASDATAQ